MIRFNLTQLCGVIGFAYFGGTAVTFFFPVTEKIQIIGLTCFALLSLLAFIYGSFASGRKHDG